VNAVADPIKVEGLNQFARNLKKLDADLPKALRVALNSSAELVVDRARPDVPRRSGRARGSIRPRSTRTAVRVTGGGRRAPYYPWLDFGGRVGRRRSVARAFMKDGRYIYDAYFKLKAAGEFQEALEDALLDVARQAGVEVE
jgi:hypothetical protein